MKPRFTYIFTLSLLMSFLVGVVMSITMMLRNGQPLEPVSLLANIGLATAIGLVVMLIFPVARGGEALALFYGAEPGKLAFGLLQSVVIATAMTFCVSFGMVAVGTGFFELPDGSTFIVRWLEPIWDVWGIAYLATILGLPVATWVANKAFGQK